MDKNKSRIYAIEDRLVVKLIGKDKYILRFISDLRTLYPANSMNMSPILKNRDAEGFHCFINIIMENEQ